MVTVKNIDPDNPDEIWLSLLAPYFGKEGDDLLRAAPELKAYLKARYPEVKDVRFVYSNPRPDPGTMSLLYRHETWVVIALLNPFTQKFMSDAADDAYTWLKKRFRIKKKPNKRSISKRKKRSGISR
jgi:hypothetical protein